MSRLFLFLPVALFLSACTTQLDRSKYTELVWAPSSPPYDTFQQNKKRWESNSAGKEYWYISQQLVAHDYYYFGPRLVRVVDDEVIEMYLQRESLERLKAAGFFNSTNFSPRAYFSQTQKKILTIDELFNEIDIYNTYVDKYMKSILAEEINWQDENYTRASKEARLALREEYQQSKMSRLEFITHYFSNRDYDDQLGYPTALGHGYPFDLSIHCGRSLFIRDLILGKVVIEEEYGSEWMNLENWMKKNQSLEVLE